MILESHGDVCRLGYMKLIACLADETVPKSMDFLSSLLYEAVKKLRPSSYPIKPIGLVNRPVNARNYVSVAAEMGIIDKKTQTLGEAGVLYTKLNSATKIIEFIEGKVVLEQKDVLTLNPVEKLFFFSVINSADFPLFPKVVLWVLEHETFTRMNAMNYIMEEAYVESLKMVMHKLDARRRQMVAREITEAGKFREKRMELEKSGEWINSSQYAKYRHIAPPRIEWLVDLGILRRAGRGRYIVNNGFDRLREILKNALKSSSKKLEEDILRDLATTFLPALVKPSRYEIAEMIVEAYNRLALGKEAVGLNMVERLTVYLMLERNKFVTHSNVHDVFNNLVIRFPDKMFIRKDKLGNIEISMVNMSPSEI